MKLDALMQTEIPVTSGRSNFKKEVELLQYGGLLFVLLELVLCDTIYLLKIKNK